VQLLFADAIHGSNSPAWSAGANLELIAAKPQNRRMIWKRPRRLGLDSRRMRRSCACGPPEPTSRGWRRRPELETTLPAKREARQAERLKKVSPRSVSLQGAVLCARWNEARAGAERLGRSPRPPSRRCTRPPARLGHHPRAGAEEGIKPLREAEAIAAAILQKAGQSQDRLDREHEAHAAELERLSGDLARIDADRAREAHITEDAESR